MRLRVISKTLSVSLLWGLCALFCVKAEARNDSLYIDPQAYRFEPKQLIFPALSIGIGTIGVYDGTFIGLKNSIKNDLTRLRGDHYFHADDYIQYLPAAAYLGLGAVGVKSKHTFKERFVAGATAHIVMAALTNGLKYSIREKRPDTRARNSFPSGHTALVFTGAELMRIEYGPWYGLAAYTVATSVAFLRMYNNRHWLNDVIAGAGIGILSARIGYWMLPLYQRWFHWDANAKNAKNPKSPKNLKKSRSFVTVLPAYDYDMQAMSLNVAVMF
ncbi:MAG: phosphatase PAP2 family protein [Bacteroidales bacterium]|nr:phosphatase PAP2 family protein [Bacteroidales bacterium]